MVPAETAEGSFARVVPRDNGNDSVQDLISRQRNEAMGISKPLTHEEAATTTLASMGQAGLQTLGLGAAGGVTTKVSEAAGEARAEGPRRKIAAQRCRQRSRSVRLKRKPRLRLEPTGTLPTSRLSQRQWKSLERLQRYQQKHQHLRLAPFRLRQQHQQHRKSLSLEGTQRSVCCRTSSRGWRVLWTD